MVSWLWWLAGGAALAGGVGVIVYETRKSKTASTSSSSGTTPPTPAASGSWIKLSPMAGPQGTPVYEVSPGASFALAIPSSNPMAQDLVGTLQQEAQQGAGSPLTISASSGPGQPNPADWPKDDSYGASAYRLEGKVSTDVGAPAQAWPPGLIFGATVGDVSSYSMWQWAPAAS
jgi:hypothetical protein